MLFLIKPLINKKTTQASLFTILSIIMPNLYGFQPNPILFENEEATSFIPTPNEKKVGDKEFCCTDSKKHFAVHHDDCPQTHRCKNRRKKERRTNAKFSFEHEKRVHSQRRVFTQKIDRCSSFSSYLRISLVI